MRVWLLAAVAILTVALATVGALTADAPAPLRVNKPAGHASASTANPPPPRLTTRALDRQDRVDRAHAALESRALEDRPLLTELPLELGPNRIDLAGLTANGRVLLKLTGVSRAAAEAAYRQTLRALSDPGTTYEIRWVPTSTRAPRHAKPQTGRPAPAQDAERRERELERAAVAYALAARNWSARTLPDAWLRQRAQTIGSYHRSLKRTRPSRRQLAELEKERGSNIAILAAPPRVHRNGRRAEVTVTLHERTATAGAAATAATRNQVTLRRHHTRWRVTGWTIVPGGSSR